MIKQFVIKTLRMCHCLEVDKLNHNQEKAKKRYSPIVKGILE